MKQIIAIIFILFSSFLFSQTNLGISYLNPTGPELGLNLDLRHKAKKDTSTFKKVEYLAGLSLQWMSRNNFHFTFGAHIENGITFNNKPDSKWQHELSLSTGFQNRQEVVNVSIDLQGNTSSKERESRVYIPILGNYSIRYKIINENYLFARASYGYRIRLSDTDLSQQQFLFQIGYSLNL